MKKLNVLVLLLLIVSLCSCTMPTTSVRTVDDRPTLSFKGAPQGAILFVDGLKMGEAGQFNGDPNVLTLESGTHVIKVILNNETLYEQRVFMESSLKTITLK